MSDWVMYYVCTACRNSHVRHDELVYLETYDMRLCPECVKQLPTLVELSMSASKMSDNK